MYISELNLRSIVRKSIIADQTKHSLYEIATIKENAAEEFAAELIAVAEEIETAIEDVEDGGGKEELKNALGDAEKVVEEWTTIHGDILLEDRKLLREGVGLVFAASVALAAPKVIEWITAGIGKVIGDNPEIIEDHGHIKKKYDNKWLNKIQKFSEAIHGKYLKGCELIIKAAFKAKQAIVKGKAWFQPMEKRNKIYVRLEKEKELFEKKLHKFSERLLMVIIAVFAILSGKGALDAIGHSHQGLAAIEAALGGVKTFEVSEFLMAISAPDAAIKLLSQLLK